MGRFHGLVWVAFRERAWLGLGSGEKNVAMRKELGFRELYGDEQAAFTYFNFKVVFLVTLNIAPVKVGRNMDGKGFAISSFHTIAIDKHTEEATLIATPIVKSLVNHPADLVGVAAEAVGIFEVVAHVERAEGGVRVGRSFEEKASSEYGDCYCGEQDDERS